LHLLFEMSEMLQVWRQMKSKYKSKCVICGKPIEVGEEINWSKEKGASHASCDMFDEEFQKELEKDIARGITPLKNSPF
jgi:hypothetical protein